jgi:hypothetical protein
MDLEFAFGERSPADAMAKLESSIRVDFFLILRLLASTASDDEKSLFDVLTKPLASF